MEELVLVTTNEQVSRQCTGAWSAETNGWMCLQALQEMLSASQQDLEAFLTQVYRAIAGAAPLKDKVTLPLPAPAYLPPPATAHANAISLQTQLAYLVFRGLGNSPPSCPSPCAIAHANASSLQT